ncbi:phage tail protein [Loigolactobacillus backii]|uniref:phage tail domain-containing protein n=1 Tax=Loigolactobacillus backii TaxID=375175 RepID=UPI000C1CBB81|nr:phage tail domain-containing protein [Loigolactobacillus backii]PIO80004.1 phage tail protein [Loigolactobacillus backii]
MTESIIIERLNGTQYSLDDLEIHVISFDPPGPNYQYTWTQMSEYNTVATDTQLQQTTIPLVIQIRAHDVYDYELMRQRVLKIFAGYEPFYVINLRIPYLRWKVVPEAYDFQRLSNFWFSQPITINLTCADGAAETVLSTTDNGFLSAFGYSTNTVDIPQYSFKNKTSFNIWNGGILPLRAEERPMFITLDASASSITIKNNTTGQSLTVNTTLSRGNPLTIYGLKMMVGTNSVFAKSNHAYLDFIPGNNSIAISGTTNFSVSFKTHFYY